MNKKNRITILILSLILTVSAIPTDVVEAAASKKVQYGDTITAYVEERIEGAASQGNQSISKWHKKGTDSFQIIEGASQFDYSEFDEDIDERDRKNLRQCLGKKVGQKFVLCSVGGDGKYYRRYTIKKISRSKISAKIIAKAYKDFIIRGKWKKEVVGLELKFAMIDINNDGYKEIYLTGDDGYHGEVYAYLGGKVTHIDSGFAGTYEYYKKANLIYNSSAHTGYYPESYSRFSNGYMIELANAEGYDFFDNNGNYSIRYKYYIKGKRTTKRKYNAYVKKLKKGKKKAKIILHENTVKNRQKYIK